LGTAFAGCEVELVPSRGGAFEVSLEGNMIYSKLASGRFPAYQEIPLLSLG